MYIRDGHTRHKRLLQKGSCVHRCLTKACELIDNTSWLCSCRRGLSPELAVRSFASVCSSVGQNCSDLHLPCSGETSELIACFIAVVKSEKLKSPFTAQFFSPMCVLKLEYFWKSTTMEMQRTLKKPGWRSCCASSW